MKLYTLLFLSVLFIGCKENNADKTLDNKVSLNSKEKEMIQQVKYINPEEVKGWPLKAVKEKYKPLTETEFLLNEAVISEFRVGLFNIFKGNERELPIPIKEMTWEKDSANNYTIWYKQTEAKWLPIDHLAWNKDQTF